MLTTEVKEKLKGLSKQDILTSIKTGELEIPKNDRDEFMRYAAMDTVEREKAMFGDGQPPAEVPPPSESASGASQEPPAGDTGAAPVDPPKKWWEDLGYESEEKAKEAHKSLLDLSSRQQSTIDNLNAGEGKRGQKIKELESRLQETGKELVQLREKTVPKLEAPKKPVRPKPKDFSDAESGVEGIYSDKYIEAREKYDVELEKYFEDIADYKTRVAITELKKKVSVSVVPQAVPSAEPRAKWDKLYDQDIPDFQKEFSLTTTVPIRAISENYQILASQSADAATKARAKVFLQAVPEADHKVYEKVKSAVELAYDFTAEGPAPKYKKIVTALVDNDLVGEGKPFNLIKQSTLTPQEIAAISEQKSVQGIPAIPASSLAGKDNVPAAPTNAEEKNKRLRDLTQKYNSALNAGRDTKERFEGSPEFAEWVRLRRELSGRAPSYAR